MGRDAGSEGGGGADAAPECYSKRSLEAKTRNEAGNWP